MVHDSCDFSGGDCFIADIQVFIACWGYFVSAVLWEFWILGPPDPAGQTSCVSYLSSIKHGHKVPAG